ncbi:hypothetical protein PUN28_018865 [Cardiocondyla obscurior]|uniref:Uncharacterized protein n=1 Tax=Cardiocondyla obscurior TaxID=286306 RepID=A0AAW2EG36_9HYME
MRIYMHVKGARVRSCLRKTRPNGTTGKSFVGRLRAFFAGSANVQGLAFSRESDKCLRSFGRKQSFRSLSMLSSRAAGPKRKKEIEKERNAIARRDAIHKN